MNFKPLKVGDRVVRGPQWKWDEQDGGPGGIGTVIKIHQVSIDDDFSASFNISVAWDHRKSYSNVYRYHLGVQDILPLTEAPPEKPEETVSRLITALAPVEVGCHGKEWLTPNILRQGLFRQRLGLPFREEFVSDGKLNLHELAKAYVINKPGKSSAEILREIKTHMENNAREWAAEALPGFVGVSRPRRTHVAPRNPEVYGEVELTATELETGSASYSCTRYMSGTYAIGLDQMMEAVNEDDPVAYLLESINDDGRDCLECDDTDNYDYDTEEANDWEDFEYTNWRELRENLANMVARFREEHAADLENE